MRKKSVVIVILALGLVALFAVSAAPSLACSPGYYKNHLSVWTGGVTIGGNWGYTESVHYTQKQALAWMNSPVVGDKSYTGFFIVATAWLNGGPVDPEASEWVNMHPPGSGIAASSSLWQDIEPNMIDIASYFN